MACLGTVCVWATKHDTAVLHAYNRHGTCTEWPDVLLVGTTKVTQLLASRRLVDLASRLLDTLRTQGKVRLLSCHVLQTLPSPLTPSLYCRTFCTT